MKYIKESIALVVLALAGGLMAVATADPPGTEVVCDGLSGAAFGLCTAAVNVGCGDEGVEKPGCIKIQEKFEQVTGETAPWTIPYCTDNSACAFDEFCKKPNGECNGAGLCEPVPEFCPDNLAEVSSCTGIRYQNSCIAHQYRESISCAHYPGTSYPCGIL